VLPLVLPIAVLGIAAMILGRAVGPSVLGIAVGWNRVSYWVQVAGAVLSQIFSMLAVVVAVALTLATARSKLPSRLRIAAVAASGMVILLSLPATITRLPSISSGLIGAAAAVLAILSAWEAQKSPLARAAAMILGLLGVSALLRVFHIVLLLFATSPAFAGIGRGLATASFALDAGATGLAIAWVASRNRKLLSLPALLALGTALVCLRFTMTATDDAGPAVVLLRRVADRLVSRPESYFPQPISIFMAFLTPLVAVAALFARSLVPALSGAIALALLSRGSPEMPLGAASLMIAALAVPLAGRDDRGIWRSPLMK
jgi:hypothetical protein